MKKNSFMQILGKIALLLLFLVGSLYGIGRIWKWRVAPHPFFAQFDHSPIVIAHRGGAGLRPENTMLAFSNAVTLGVDLLELDVHRTTDDQLVIIHDDTLERTTNGTGNVNEKTLSELQQLDAGYSWSADDGKTFPYRGQGVIIPTLEELFTAYPTMAMNIEIKGSNPEIAEELCQMIRQHHKENSVLVASFNKKPLDNFRQICPEIATTAAEDEVRSFFYLFLVRLSYLYKNDRMLALQLPEEGGGFKLLTKELINAAHERGIRVDAWTINESADIERLLPLGLDGIITDYPDRALKIIK